MRIRPWLLVASFLACGSFAGPILAIQGGTPSAPELHIDPGTTGVPLGQARLIIEPLKHLAGQDGMSADYRVEITPFAFKNEAGRFTVAISEADLQRLADGATLHFTGTAVSRDGSDTSVVEGRATPTSGDGGALRIQVAGSKGKLVFHTTYHLARTDLNPPVGG